MPDPPTTWGNKRARTGPSGPTPPAPPTSSGGGGARDCANLADGPTGLIAELVLANNIADYVRFRAVCRAWRQCSPDPRGGQGDGGLDARFLPRQWIMLDKAHAAVRRHRFLNVSTGECIRTDIPELADHTLLALTHEGLLLMLHEPTLAVRLLNPLTRRLTELPPVTALLTEQELRDWRSGTTPLHDMLRVAGAGLADASTLAVSFRWPTALAVARPGDERWTVVDDRFMDSTLSCAGRFYWAIRSGVMVLDTSTQPPRLRPVVTERGMPFRFFRTSHSLNLVDNAGELVLVRRTIGQDGDTRSAKRYRRKCMVFTVDFNSGALAPAKDLRGRAVFLSLHRTISVSPGAFSSVTADTLYLGYDCAEKIAERNPIDGYNVADGSSKPSYHELGRSSMVHPCSLVDCLSHCIQGNGEHLA